MARFQIRDLFWLTLVVALLLGLFSCFKYVDIMKSSNDLLRAETKKLKQDSTDYAHEVSFLNEKLRTSDRAGLLHESFYIRGCALLALDRHEEAAASFEVAIQKKPDDLMTIDYLINSYTGASNERQADKYRKRRQEVLDRFSSELVNTGRQAEAYQRRLKKLEESKKKKRQEPDNKASN